MSAVLSVRNLDIDLRKDRSSLVSGVSFDIQQGEVFALVGESGSGKSLTALSIMRLLPEALEISGGRVELQEQDLFTLAELEMNSVRGKKIAMIFQEPQTSLNPVHTVGKQLYEVLSLHRGLTQNQARPLIIELLIEVGIPDPEQRLNWYPHQLSGGQKQRVMIAMALACEPDLLIADEPTTALDVTIQKQVLNLLKALCKKRQLAVLLITHDIAVVSEMADRIAVMRYGEIIEQSDRDTFFSSPKHEYSRLLISSLPDTKHYIGRIDKKPLLEVRDLRVWFPVRKGLLQRVVAYTKAVDSVSFSIGEGETLALVGESGSGKTTIGKAVLRLNDISEGSVFFDGQCISEFRRKKFLPFRKDIQVIFQDPFSSMNPRMTVRSIIEEGMISLNVESDANKRDDQIAALLERVGLSPEHLERYPHEFSGGQRQRIAIARALAVQPRLIICDEPTSALDVSIRGQVLDLLKQLQREEGISYLFITHDLSLIPHLAHKVAVMKNGVIVEQGNTEQVMTRPENDYTIALLTAAPKIEESASA